MCCYRFDRKFYQNHRPLSSRLPSINEFPTLEAFFSWGSVATLINDILPHIAYRYPQAKIILKSHKVNRDDLIRIFNVAWVDHMILNILIMNYWEDNHIENCLFNPFSRNKPDMNCTLLTDKVQIDAYFKMVDQYTNSRITKLNGHTLSIAMHESEGSTSAFDCILDDFEMIDTDMNILKIMQEKMNFTTNYIFSELELSVGYVSANGSLAGTLGLIENNKIDLAANSRIIHYYETGNLLYLDYITTEKLKFLVPIDFFKNRDKEVIFINPFSLSYLTINTLLSILIPLLMHSMDKLLTNQRTLVDHSTFGESVMRTMGILYNESVRHPRNSRKRWILFGILVYNVVSYPVWQAVTIRYLNSNNQHINNINSLQELIDTNLKLKVSKYHHHVVIHEGIQFQNKLYRELANRLSTKGTRSIRTAIENIITKRDSAFLTSDMYAPLVLAGSYKWVPNAAHTSGVYVISEPIYEFYKSMVVPKTSPFIQTFNDIISWCVESGVVEQQNRQLQGIVNLLNIRRTMELGKDKERLFDMEVLWFLFAFYLIMMVLSMVVFLLEIVYYHCKQRKKMEKAWNFKQVAHMKQEEKNIQLFEYIP